MTTRHDDARFDSIAVLAVGALPPAEARELEAHIAECELCRREYDEMRAAVDALALSAELTPAEFGGEQCARLRSRVMDAVRASAAPPTTSKVTVLAERRRPVATWIAYAAAAAGLVLAIFSTWNLVRIAAQTKRAPNSCLKNRDSPT
jgi:anti-sigma factor RsiW